MEGRGFTALFAYRLIAQLFNSKRAAWWNPGGFFIYACSNGISSSAEIYTMTEREASETSALITFTFILQLTRLDHFDYIFLLIHRSSGVIYTCDS